MNRTTTTGILVKFIMTFILAGIALALVVSNPWSWILVVAIIVTAANYLAGDLMILPRWGNIVAAIANGIIAALVAYIISSIVPGLTISGMALALFAVLMAVGEYVFYQFFFREEKVESPS